MVVLRRSSFAVLVVAILLIVLMAALSVVGTRGRTSQIDQTLDDYVVNGYVDRQGNQLIWNVAQNFVSHTKFAHNISINDRIQEGALNLFILRKDPDRQFPNLSCNCGAVQVREGKSPIIVCDAALINYFRHLLEDADINRGRLALQQSVVHDPADGSIVIVNGERYSLATITSIFDKMSPQEFNDSYDSIMTHLSYSLLSWLIGHEVGHVINGPSEDVADRYVISHLSDQEAPAYMWITLGSVVKTLYAQELENRHAGQGSLVNLNTPDWPPIDLLYSANDPHPPLLLRALNMSERLHGSEGDVVDESGFEAQVRSRVRQMRSGTPPVDLCHSSSRPRLDVALTSLSRKVPDRDEVMVYLNDASQYWHLAEYQQSLAVTSKTIDFINSLSNLPPDQRGSLLAQAYDQRGKNLFVLGDYRQALASFLAAMQLDVNMTTGYSDAGFAEYELGQISSAISYWQKAVQAHGNTDGNAWAGMAIGLASQGRMNEAVNAYKQALSLEEGYSSLSWIRYERHWTERGLNVANKLITMAHPK
jgi:hypothetical protein